MEQPWWKQQLWREIQTNLREIDMLDIDAAEYARQIQLLDANVAMINVGGILSSYETDLPFHFQSPYLKGDSLAKIIEACHAAGIRVVARMDFSKIRRPIYEMHPDWAYRTPSGGIVDYNGDIHACVCGGFQQEAMYEIIAEVCEKLPIDGLFINMGGFQTRDYSYRQHGLCHCDSCKRMFRAFSGMDLPDEADMNDPAYRRYRAFQRKVLGEQKERLDALIRGINPQIAINGTDFFRMESNTEYGRPLPYWQYSASSNTRCLRGVRSGRISSNTTVDFIGFYLRHVAVDAAQQKLRLWQDVANLGGLDFYIIGRLDNHQDKSAYDAVREVFHFHSAHEAEYRDLQSIADVLLMRDHHWGDSKEERGWIRALTEGHILFDEAEAHDMEAGDLSGYKAIILPANEILSDALVKKLDAYAQAGGTLIVCGDAGRVDGEFEPRQGVPFACLGVEKPLLRSDAMLSAMFELSDAEHMLFPSHPRTNVIAAGETYWYGAYTPDTAQHLRLIPPQFYGPPERCYHTSMTAYPGVTVRPAGKGQGVYVPWLPGTMYYQQGYGNSLGFMVDVLTSIAGVRPVSDASPMLEITLAEKSDGSMALLQLVNNSGHFGTSYMDPLPVPDVSVSIPCAGKATRAVSLRDGREVPFTASDGRLTLSLGTVGEFDSIAITMAE
ncbi:beta-galactosidase trimerization domain-containing protein [Eubacteriales bacterium OttesenSCG-928-A19]|nr:beta-galactosidase trimerization domain-containing protein [Eubacteriales bacterium OttesenSCG-928-A19]